MDAAVRSRIAVAGGSEAIIIGVSVKASATSIQNISAAGTIASDRLIRHGMVFKINAWILHSTK